MRNIETRLSKLENMMAPLARNIVIEAADGLDDAALDSILADHGVVPNRADLVVHLRRLVGINEEMPARVAVNSVEQPRVAHL